MQPSDWVLFYSPKLEYKKPEKYQHFTAIAKIAGDRIYQHDMGNGFVPFRRNVRFLPARDIPIRPLIDALAFIKDKTHWGAPFCFGTLQIPEVDFKLIAREVLDDEQYQPLRMRSN